MSHVKFLFTFQYSRSLHVFGTIQVRKVRVSSGKFGKGQERSGKVGKVRERSGKFGKGRERSGKFGKGWERSGKFGKVRERSGKVRKGRERSGKFGERLCQILPSQVPLTCHFAHTSHTTICNP